MSTQPLSRRFIILATMLSLCLGVGQASVSGAVVRLGPDCDRYRLTPHASVFEDPSGRLGVADVESRRFSPLTGDSVNFGVTTSTHWLRFTIAAAPGAVSDGWILHIGRPYIASARLYTRGPKGWTVAEAGAVTGADGVRRNVAPAFTLPEVTEQPQAIYLQVSSYGSSFLAPEVCTLGRYLAEGRNRMLLLGLYYGAVIALALYNLMLFASLRDKSYLWYVIYLAFAAAYFVAQNGLAFEYLPSVDPMVISRTLLLCVSGGFIAAILFARSFLLTARLAPAADRLLLAAMGICAVSAFCCPFLDFRALDSHYALAAALVICAIIAAGIICWIRGFKPASYFVLGWTLYAVSGWNLSLIITGLIPYTDLGYYGFQISSAIEAVLLAFALADRIRSLRKEWKEARRDRMVYKQQAITDELTGLYNAAHFRSRIGDMARVSQFRGDPLVLVMMDIDDFKRLNDTYGHLEGDSVLSRAGHIIRSSIRECDAAFRYGGEEFAIVLPGSSADQAALVVERICSAVRDSSFSPKHAGQYRVTLSAGIAEYSQGEEVSEFIRRADDALYRAKAAGKDTVVRSGDPQGHTAAKAS